MNRKEYIKKTERKEIFFNELWKISEDKEELRRLFAEGIRKMALENTKNNSKNRIILVNINPNRIYEIASKYGIFNRFYITENNKVNYCTGQDYIEERKAIRNLLVKSY